MTDAKSSCLICQIIEGKVPSKKVYEDEHVLAVLDFNGANPGHCLVLPKTHYPIIEQVPDFEVGKLFEVANAISSGVFETLNIQGTNIFVQNGVSAGQTVAHFMVHVVPRMDNDGINLIWQPKQLDEEEMSTIEIKLKAEAENIGGFEIKQLPGPKETAAHAKKEEAVFSDEEDYLIKQLERIP